ncbi:MAG: zinc dependent phospholipase C family protein [Desulfatiglandaceae bacterium]
MLFLIKVVLFVCFLQVMDGFAPVSALAWGPGIHTAIALVTLGQAELLLPSIAGVIAAFPIQYLYGCLAADFFIGKGRRKRRKSHFHCWDGGFKLLDEAGDNEEASYSYGFLTHLAADVIAHNYFIPNVIQDTHSSRRLGHLYWELRSDYLVGPGYTRIAKEILSLDHESCDTLLSVAMSKETNGLRTKKRLYTQGVRLSDFLYAASPLFLSDPAWLPVMFKDDLSRMVALSCRLVQDSLENLEDSLCISYDPLGQVNLRLARERAYSFLRKGLSTAHLNTHFPVDEELLML